MHFKSNSDKLHEQAFSKNLSLFDLITEVTEVSVFLLVEENKGAMKINNSFALGPLYL